MLNSLSPSHTHTHAHTHTCTHSHTLTQHTPAEDAKPINLSAVFVSGTGVVLSWQLPPLASNQTDVQLDSYFINFTRMGSREYMTLTSQTPKIAIGGLDLGQTYEFRVSANYFHPVLQSAEEILTQRTGREFCVLTD